MTLTAVSSTSSSARLKHSSHATRASVAAFGSIHTVTTPSTSRRYGNGVSSDSANEPSSELNTEAVIASSGCRSVGQDACIAVEDVVTVEPIFKASRVQGI